MTSFISKDDTPSAMGFDPRMSVDSLTPVTSTNNTETSSSGSLNLKHTPDTLSEGKTPSSWDSKDDILLRHLKEIKKLGWKEIAQYFSNRTPNACQFRWRRLRSGSLKHKSIAQSMELESVKLQGELEVPTKHIEKAASTRNSSSSSSSSRRGSSSSGNYAISQTSSLAIKKKQRSRSIPSSLSPNLRQQGSSKPHGSVGQSSYDSFSHMTPPSHNFSISSHISNSTVTSRYRQNSLTNTPPATSSFTSSPSIVYPIVNDEQVGYIPKIKIRSRRNSTVSLSTRQQPSTTHNATSYLDNPQPDFRNRSNSASNTVVSIERRLSVLLGSTNIQFNSYSSPANGGSGTPGSRRGSGMVYYNPNSIYNSSSVPPFNSISTSAPEILGKTDEDVAIEDD